MTQNDEVQATVSPLYAVPLLHAQLPGADALNAELRALFLDFEAQGDRHRDIQDRDTQHGIFESNFYLHRRQEPAVRQLFAHVDSILKNFIRGINGFDDERMDNIEMDMHSWFHVTRRGGFQSVHNHPNASWSAIYCVDPGDSPEPQSGIVRFHDPRVGSDMYRDPANEHMQVPYRIGAWKLSHRAGQLIAFPSYLLHEVFPYTGERPRIVVALNAWCRWKTPPL